LAESAADPISPPLGPFQEGSNSTLYIVQELLSTGEQGFWCANSNLEVFSRQSFNPVAQNRRLRVG
jgi:hypothetical protein